jgi:acetylornithine deacetylase/succinyl-diaminopimelate desuccinylase-like protein
MIEQSVGLQADWKKVDALMMQTAQVAEKVARYKHAALSAVKLAGDFDARVTDNASLDELLDKIKDELRKLGPLIDLEAIWEPRGSRAERGLSKSVLPAGRSGI